MKEGNDTVVYETKSKANIIFWAFFGIIAFITIYFPLYGGSLRFETGSLISQVLDVFGQGCRVIGFLFMIWGLFGLLCGSKSRAVSLMIMGFMLFMISSYIINPGSVFYAINDKELPAGYHSLGFFFFK